MNKTIDEFAHNYLGSMTYSNVLVKELMEKAKNIDTPLHKEFILRHMKYTYPTQIHYSLAELIDTLLETISQEFKTLYIMHYSYEYALLGYFARKKGLKVHGYFMDEEGQLMQSNRHHEPIPARIWDKDYIGDRLSKMVTGQPLNRKTDFINILDNPYRDKVTFFPTTRSMATNAENWDMDYELLRYKGYRMEMVHLYDDFLPKKLAEKDVVRHVMPDNAEAILEMIGHIQRSEFIICYDSASFHFAWLTDTPAIVKLKGGFNEEWIPTWVKHNPSYYFIPSNEMYEEEYLTYLQKGLNQLGV